MTERRRVFSENWAWVLSRRENRAERRRAMFGNRRKLRCGGEG
jgi:hypothetical protein